MQRSPIKTLLIIGLSLLGAATLVLGWLLRPSKTDAARSPQGAESSATPSILQYAAAPIGLPVEGRPMITHVLIHDLDGDGRADVIACDAQTNTVRWLRQIAPRQFEEEIIGDTVLGPAHAAIADVNADGRPDLLVAGMGVVLPNNDKVGSVVILENLGGRKFRNRVVLENVSRVTDVQPGDFNADGKLDLAVAQFGYVEGEVRWLENLGDWKFRSHILSSEPGAINVPIADFNTDRRPDFAALISQDSEAVHLYTSQAGAAFRDDVIWQTGNDGWGSSGLAAADINRDGKTDLVFTNGDGFDGLVSLPKWHGLQWLENVGGGSFRQHRVGDFPGCYSPAVADLDGDGDMDLVAVSAFNNWNDARAVSLCAWLNDGRQNFTPVSLATSPTHLISVAVGDMDGDGVEELVTGGFHVYPPFKHMSRITLWTRRLEER